MSRAPTQQCPICGKMWDKKPGNNAYCPPCWKNYSRPRSSRYTYQFAGPAFYGKPYDRKDI